jgi:eukaryotic-like serine/threonine-protein kinase
VNRERWQRITETFDAALECSPDSRNSFLEQACAGDDALLSEVVRLLTEFERAGDFLEKSLVTPGQAVLSGDLIAGRYRIGVLLGRGGMGEVYRAHDEFMDEDVALKTLRSELSGNPEILRRFRREIRLGRKITHPNVCRVFEVGIHNLADHALHFFTMQLLDGETLVARIRRTGPLSVEEALPLIVQMAEGLQAAHQAGIIHRDFKSSNVILSDGKAIITDFGLARFEPTVSNLETGSNVSANAQLAGTVAYMSPEQLSGGKINAASDIYSFGIVLFEMATGRLPFDDRHIIQSAMQRAYDSVPNVRAMAPKIEPQWAATITRCLQRDPSKRFPNVTAVASHLQPNRWRPPMAYWSRRRWTKAVAATGGISLLAVALFGIIPRLGYRDMQAGAKIMVTPAVNATGEERFDALTTALRTSVGQSSRFNLWDIRRLSAVVQTMRREPGGTLTAKDWREIAFREGSPFVVFSTLGRIGDGYSLTLHAEQIGAAPDPPMRTWDQTIPISSFNAVFDGIHEASSWVRTTAGETPTELSAFNLLPQDITSSSWEALQLYEKGQQLSQKGIADQAIPFLRRAIDQDSHFAMALMRLGDMLVSQRNGQEGFYFWRRAIIEGRAQHLSEHERLNLEGRYTLEIGDYAKAEPILREWMNKFPNDPRPSEWIVPTLYSLAQFPASVEASRAHDRRFGPSTLASGQVIHSLGMLNRLDEITAEIASLERIGNPTLALRFRGLLAAARKDYSTAKVLFEKYATQTHGIETSHAASFLAHLAADRGDLAGAVEILRNGIEADNLAGRHGLAAIKSSGIAYLELQMSDRARARQWALEAVRLEPSAEIISRTVTILARLNFLTEAKSVLKRMPDGEGPTFESLIARSNAEILIANKQFDLAVQLLQQADRVGDPSQLERHARTLALAGQTEGARQLYLTLATLPWTCWSNPEKEWPGICWRARREIVE